MWHLIWQNHSWHESAAYDALWWKLWVMIGTLLTQQLLANKRFFSCYVLPITVFFSMPDPTVKKLELHDLYSTFLNPPDCSKAQWTVQKGPIEQGTNVEGDVRLKRRSKKPSTDRSPLTLYGFNPLEVKSSNSDTEVIRAKRETEWAFCFMLFDTGTTAYVYITNVFWSDLTRFTIHFKRLLLPKL